MLILLESTELWAIRELALACTMQVPLTKVAPPLILQLPGNKNGKLLKLFMLTCCKWELMKTLAAMFASSSPITQLENSRSHGSAAIGDHSVDRRHLLGKAPQWGHQFNEGLKMGASFPLTDDQKGGKRGTKGSTTSRRGCLRTLGFRERRKRTKDYRNQLDSRWKCSRCSTCFLWAAFLRR